MDSPDQSATSSTARGELIFRCGHCGVESGEATCFLPARLKSTPPVRTCITCGRRSVATSQFRFALATFWMLFLPLFFLFGFKDKSPIIFPKLVLAICLIQPLTLVLHEFGHFATARLLGLEVSLITIGVGPKVWVGKAFGTVLRIHAWPLSGMTYLGSRSLRFLRLRVWLTALMGPGTNLLLIAAGVIYWDPLVRTFNANIVILGMMFNAFAVFSNLIPYRSRKSGQQFRTDGFQLLQIPFRKSTDLEVYLYAAAVTAATLLFNDQNYEGARRVCLEALARLRRHPALSLLVSACHISLGDYESGRAALDFLSDPSVSLTLDVRAPLENNLALALLLRDFNTDQTGESLRQADAIIERAYKAYPCVLTYRTNRALLLAAMGKPEDALSLLDYMNYQIGTADERSHQLIARAFALRGLNRSEESEQALSTGLKLCKTLLPWVVTIGLVKKSTPDTQA